VAVRWNGAISRYFTVNSGVRQGSILTPSLFIVFINVLIVKLRESGDGCIVNNQYVGCIVYADDIIILSCTIHGLQHMLNTCYEIAANLKLVFNCNKSKCITFGPGCKLDISDMYPDASTIKWCHTKVSGSYFAVRPT